MGKDALRERRAGHILAVYGGAVVGAESTAQQVPRGLAFELDGIEPVAVGQRGADVLDAVVRLPAIGNEAVEWRPLGHDPRLGEYVAVDDRRWRGVLGAREQTQQGAA